MITAIYDNLVKMYSPMNEKFVQWIQDGLNETGWSRAELARRAGMTRGGINNIINNYRNKPMAKTVRAIARAMLK